MIPGTHRNLVHNSVLNPDYSGLDRVVDQIPMPIRETASMVFEPILLLTVTYDFFIF